MQKHSNSYKKGIRLVVEMESETKIISNTTACCSVKKRNWSKQIVIDFQAKMIDFGESTYGVDILKKSI